MRNNNSCEARHCIILYKEDTARIKEIGKILAKVGEDKGILNKSFVIRKALEVYLKLLKETK